MFLEYGRLGKTGFKVSRLGLGGAPIGGDFGPLSEQEAIDIIHEALDLGITFFDTAPLYGRGESEIRMGKGLKGKRNQIILATKAVMRGDPYTYENTMKSVEDSLHRLQTDWVDLIQLHEAENVTFEEGMNGTVAAFLKLKEQGKVRAIGVNAGDPAILLSYIRTGEIDTVQNYAHFMLIDQMASRELLPLARQYDVGVINGSPLGMGILADTPAPFMKNNQERLEEAERRKEKVAFLRKREPFGLIEPAMRFSLTCPDISVTLSGASSVEIIRKNAGYCDGAGLSAEEERQIYKLFADAPSLF